jgi:hypothetical protein
MEDFTFPPLVGTRRQFWVRLVFISKIKYKKSKLRNPPDFGELSRVGADSWDQQAPHAAYGGFGVTIQ